MYTTTASTLMLNHHSHIKYTHTHTQTNNTSTQTLTLFNGPYLVSCRVSAVLNGVGVRGEHSMMERLRVGVLNLRKRQFGNDLTAFS